MLTGHPKTRAKTNDVWMDLEWGAVTTTRDALRRPQRPKHLALIPRMMASVASASAGVAAAAVAPQSRRHLNGAAASKGSKQTQIRSSGAARRALRCNAAADGDEAGEVLRTSNRATSHLLLLLRASA